MTLTLRSWHRCVIWSGGEWVGHRCANRVGIVDVAACDRWSRSSGKVEGWGRCGLLALHHLAAWISRVRNNLAVWWRDNSIHGWTSTDKKNVDIHVISWLLNYLYNFCALKLSKMLITIVCFKEYTCLCIGICQSACPSIHRCRNIHLSRSVRRCRKLPCTDIHLNQSMDY